MVSVTERVLTLFFSPWGGGRDRGYPPGPHLRGSRFSRLPPLCLPPTRRLFQNERCFWWFVEPGGPGQAPRRPRPRPKALEAPAPCPKLLALAPTPGPKTLQAPQKGGAFGGSRRPVLITCFGCTIDFLSPGHPKLGAGRPACWL